MKVYSLLHKTEVETNIFDVKRIGIYSSFDVAKATIEIYKNIKGFKDYPDNFYIEELNVLDKTQEVVIPGQMLYLLEHEYTIEEANKYYDYVTVIGIFLSLVNANAAMEKLKKNPDYINKKSGIYEDNSGFCISNYIVDENNWQEGFVTFDSV